MMASSELIIRPRKGWQPVDFQEIYRYRDLFAFLVWRDVKVRYRQTLLGGTWAIIQPLVAMLIFTVVFHRLAGVNSDGTPYPLFAFAGLAPWTFFATAVSQSSNSLVGNHQLVSKIYFPRFFVPMAAITALLLDLAFSLALLAVLLVYYKWPVSPSSLLLLPVFIVAAFLSAGGAGLILSALNVSFRDVKYAVPFLVQMGIFVTPVIYPVRYIPPKWQILFGLNPMAGVVLGFRHALLGAPVNWNVMAASLTMSVLIFVVGLICFRRMERRFADII
jgi:lipopolysaccharide transport system permease protein